MPGYYDIVGGLGDGIRSPGFVLAEMRTIDAGIQALGADIQRDAAELPDGFMANWIAFRVEWSQFFKDNAGWLSRATNPIYDKTVEFRNRLQQWRDRFVKAGGDPTTPALPETSGFPVAALLVGTAIVGVAVWYLFKTDHT